MNEAQQNRKPLGIKGYGHIPHLPNSRMGIGDHACHEGQEQIATNKPRDKWDEIIVQEKLDGSNVGVAMLNGEILAITRSGYLAMTSPYSQHWYWADFVAENKDRFQQVLCDGERIIGEWLIQAHGTRYNLPHEPLVVFDIMTGSKRLPYDDFLERVSLRGFITPHLIHRGNPLGVGDALRLLGDYGYHGALDVVEGAVWRVERHELVDKKKGGQRKRVVDFLAKYVRPDKVDGSYLKQDDKPCEVWNIWEA